MFPQAAPQSNSLLSALGASGPGAPDPMAMMGLPGMGGPGMPGMAGMGMGGQPGMMAMAGMSPMGDPSMMSPMGEQLPPGLEGLSPQEIQAVLAMLAQYGMPTQNLQNGGGMPGMGMMGQQAGGMAPVVSPQDLDLSPGAAAAPARSYGPFGG